MVIASVTFPTQVCAETNWIALDANGLARNQAGELWDVESALPNPQAGAAAVCSLVTSNWMADRVYSVPVWTRARIRADGTLWTARFLPQPAPAVVLGEWRQLGSRSDWLATWGHGAAEFGLTADGTVWTWGLQLDKDPVKTYQSRLALLRDRLTGHPWNSSPASITAYSFSAQPRPLLKLITGKARQR